MLSSQGYGRGQEVSICLLWSLSLASPPLDPMLIQSPGYGAGKGRWGLDLPVNQGVKVEVGQPLQGTMGDSSNLHFLKWFLMN